jgi:hypothetical protein
VFDKRKRRSEKKPEQNKYEEEKQKASPREIKLQHSLPLFQR